VALYLRQLPEPIQFVLPSHDGMEEELASDLVARMADSELLVVWDSGDPGEAERLAPLPVLGQHVVRVPTCCTVGPDGMCTDGVRVVGTPAGVRAAVRSFPSVGRVTYAKAEAMLRALASDLGRAVDLLDPERHALMCFVDGSRGGSELLAAALATAASDIPLVGGSFLGQGISLDGTWRRNGAAVALLESEVPLAPFLVQPFHLTSVRTVVTACDGSGHLVEQLDGLPAVPRFCELAGVSPDALLGSPAKLVRRLPVQLAWVVAGRPVTRPVVRVHGETLELQGAVHRGTVLRVVERDPDAVGAMLAGVRSAVATLAVPPAASWTFACRSVLEGGDAPAMTQGLQQLGVTTCASDGLFHGPVHTCGGIAGLVWGDGGR
jgi:hypothetical protein